MRRRYANLKILYNGEELQGVPYLLVEHAVDQSCIFVQHQEDMLLQEDLKK